MIGDVTASEDVRSELRGLQTIYSQLGDDTSRAATGPLVKAALKTMERAIVSLASKVDELADGTSS